MNNEDYIKLGHWHGEIDKSPKSITTVAEYNGEEDVTIWCTQLMAPYKSTDQKKIVKEWCTFFEQPNTIKRLWLASKVSQELFDALCHQPQLTSLFIKWSGIHDISKIKDLTNLHYLYFGSSGSITDITPLSQLPQLKNVYLESFQKVSDYSPLSHLTNLEGLALTGNVWTPKKLNIDSLIPLKKLSKLQSLDLAATVITDQSYSVIAELHKLEKLDLTTKLDDDTRELILSKLPKLKYGLFLGMKK